MAELAQAVAACSRRRYQWVGAVSWAATGGGDQGEAIWGLGEGEPHRKRGLHCGASLAGERSGSGAGWASGWSAPGLGSNGLSSGCPGR
jgi:hypothetical protein